MKLKNPFELEKLRSQLAKEGKYKELAKTYTKTNSEIDDWNTSRLWDRLNLVDKKEIL